MEFRVVSDAVVWIAYTPVPKDSHLLCRNAPETQPGKFPITIPRFWFDRYGDLTFREEKKRENKSGSGLRFAILSPLRFVASAMQTSTEA
jgi:hypothetical protein